VNDRGHDRWSDEVSAYALGALSPAEAREVEAHLAECERCRTELRWLEPAVDVLGASVTQLTPPPALRERLVAETAADAREDGRAAARTGWRRFWPSWATRPVTALAATALLAAGVAGYALRGDEGGDPPAPAPQMALERQGDSGTLRVTNLPEPDAGVYQVWIQHGDEVSPSSSFVTDAEGDATTRIPADLSRADAVLVTHEPSAHMRQPSGEPLVQTALD
jgi:anti-sigma-K factor RskA